MNEQDTTLQDRLAGGSTRLINALKGRGWTQARVLGPLVAHTPREIRAAAAASGGRVIAGQRGYCLIEEASVPEVEQSASWLISQGNKMIARGLEIRRRSQVREAAL